MKRHGSSYLVPKDIHRVCGRGLLYVTLLGVVVVLVFALVLPQMHDHPWIYWIHIHWFAPEFLILLTVVVVWINGKRFPRLHPYIASVVSILALGTNAIGFYMAWIMH
jgi:hypothetical protein